MTTVDLPILIADDNDINRWLLAEQLQHWSRGVTMVEHGGQAWECLQRDVYALVFLDVNMPVLNGFDLVKKVRAEKSVNRLTPVIAVTAHAQVQQRQTLIQSGFNDCLIKPIVLADLRKVIAQWVYVADEHNAAYYAGAALKKTEFNVELAGFILQKLFEELPSQLDDIQRALDNQQFRQAWDVVHKLQGSVCFLGFADFQALIECLELSLLDKNQTAAYLQFNLLKRKFSELIDNQAAVLAGLEMRGI